MLSLNALVRRAHLTSFHHGWWEGLIQETVVSSPLFGRTSVPEVDNPDGVLRAIPEKLCLVHSEVSEALEAYRDGDMGLRFGAIKHADGCSEVEHAAGRWRCPVCAERAKVEGFSAELADVLIRVFDLAGALGIDLERAVALKMEYNESRPHRHGGKAC